MLRQDAMFFEQDLIALSNRVLYTEYAPLSSEILIPAKQYPIGTNAIAYRKYDFQGRAKEISGKANDIPMISLSAEEFLDPVTHVSIGYEVTTHELRQAAKSNTPIQELSAKAAMEAYKQEFNKYAFFGSPVKKVKGWINNPDINKASVAGNDANDKKWLTKIVNPLLILTDILESYEYVMKRTKGRYRPDTMVLPISQYILLQKIPYDFTGTILDKILSTTSMTVYAAEELTGAFTGGTDGFIMYQKNDMAFHEAFVGEPIVSAPQLDGLVYKTYYEGYSGGTIVTMPETQAFRYGI